MNINNHMDDDEIELRPQSSSDQTEDSESSQTETLAGDEQRHEERAAEPPPYPPVFQWAVTAGHRVGRWWTTYVQPVVREQDGLLRDYFCALPRICIYMSNDMGDVHLSTRLY